MGTSARVTQRHTVLASVLLLLSSVLLLGCPRDAVEGPPATVTVPSAAPTTPSSPPVATTSAAPNTAGSEDRWLGSWASDSCGERSYRRVIQLAVGGKVSGEDRVSPCPPKVACVWSGIVTWSGSWRVEGERIALELVAAGGGKGAAVTLPRELTWDAAATAPAETHGDLRCVYQALSGAH